jgi:iron(III) transport system permease protein
MAFALPSRAVMRIRRPALAPYQLALGCLILLLAWLTLVPLAEVFVTSFTSSRAAFVGAFTLANYIGVFSNPTTYELMWNSIVFAVGNCCVACALGTGLAWVIERTNTPFRRVFYIVTLLPLIVPDIVMTIAWIFLLSPQTGALNAALRAAFGLSAPPFNIYTLGGMIWVQGLSSSPLVFLLVSSALRLMDTSLEEAASASGASALKTFRHVTAPLMLPAIVSVVLIVLVHGLEGFEVPALIGLPSRIFVFTSRIYQAIAQAPSDYGTATALAAILAVISLAGILVYQRLTRQAERFATVSGKAFRARPIDLGWWRYVTLAALCVYGLLMIGLPMLVLVWMSLVPFAAPPSVQMLGRLTLDNYHQMLVFPNVAVAFRNGLFVSGATAAGTVVMSGLVAWIALRSRLPGRRLLETLSFIPIAVPGTVLGTALLALYVGFPIPIYGTLVVLFLAYTTRFLPLGMRVASGTLVQLHPELEEAAAVSGAAWWSRFRMILLPLMRSGLMAGAIYIFIVSFRELSSSAVLTGPNNMVMAVLIFELQDSGLYPQVAALAVLMVIGLAIMVAILRRVGRSNAEV